MQEKMRILVLTLNQENQRPSFLGISLHHINTPDVEADLNQFYDTLH